MVEKIGTTYFQFRNWLGSRRRRTSAIISVGLTQNPSRVGLENSKIRASRHDPWRADPARIEPKYKDKSHRHGVPQNIGRIIILRWEGNLINNSRKITYYIMHWIKTAKKQLNKEKKRVLCCCSSITTTRY